MKTLSDFKRELRIRSKWLMIHANCSTPQIREVEMINSACVGFKTDRGTISYLYWPRAKDIEFGQNGEVLIYSPESIDPNFSMPRRHILTYQAVE